MERTPGPKHQRQIGPTPHFRRQTAPIRRDASGRRFVTHAEEPDVVPDEVVDDGGLLRRPAPSLEQARREDGGQLFTGHVVQLGALVDPGRRGRG